MDSFPKAQLFCVCRAEKKQKWESVTVLPWQAAFKALGLE
jgi:hypothetical protein